MCLPFHEIVNVSTIFGEVFLLFFQQALTPCRGHESGAIVVVNAILEYVLQQIDSICIFTRGGGKMAGDINKLKALVVGTVGNMSPTL